MKKSKGKSAIATFGVARVSTKLVLLGLVIGFPILLFSVRQTTEVRQRANTITPQVSVLPSPTIPISISPQTCIPHPSCLDTKPRCELPQPAIGWCPPSNKPLTNDEINTVLIYLSSVLKNLKK